MDKIKKFYLNHEVGLTWGVLILVFMGIPQRWIRDKIEQQEAIEDFPDK